LDTLVSVSGRTYSGRQYLVMNWIKDSRWSTQCWYNKNYSNWWDWGGNYFQSFWVWNVMPLLILGTTKLSSWQPGH